MTEPATQTNGAAAPATAAPDFTPSKPATLQERMVSAAKATKAAVDEGKPEAEAIVEGVAAADEPAPAEAAEAKEAKTKPDGKTVADENPIARIRREMRSREKARSIEIEATQKREAVERDAAAFQKQQQEFQQQQQRFAQMMQKFQENPMEALEQNGWNREKLAEHFANSGKPEHAMAQQLEALKLENQRIIQHLQQTEEQRARAETAAQQQAREQAERTAERKFVTDFASPDKTPNLHHVAKISRQGERYIVSRANEVADWFKAETGKYPSWDVLADYLEQQASEDLKEVGVPSKAPKPAGKSTATTRTLSQEMSGERRSAVKPLQELSKSERLAAMEQAARDARRSAG